MGDECHNRAKHLKISSKQIDDGKQAGIGAGKGHP